MRKLCEEGPGYSALDQRGHRRACDIPRTISGCQRYQDYITIASQTVYSFQPGRHQNSLADDRKYHDERFA